LVLASTAGLLARAQQTKQVSVDGLIYDLKHPEADRRKAAAQLLGQNQVRQAVPSLIELTQDQDGSVRLEAIRALVRINDIGAVPAYIRLTQDPVKAVQEKAIEGIINAYVVEEGGLVAGAKKFVQFVNPFSEDYNAVTVEPFVQVSPEAAPALAVLLRHQDAALRKDAAAALGILRAESALPDIQAALREEIEVGVQVELIRAIYKIGKPEAGESVVPLVRDPDKKVHDEAIFTVGRLKTASALPHLKELYEANIQERRKILKLVPASGADDLMRRIYEALAYIGDPSCKDLFLAGLADERPFYRRYAAEGLGRIGDQSQTTLLGEKYLREKVAEVKLALGYSLYRMGREEHLLELAQGGDQGLDYLLELTPSEVPRLYPYLGTEKDSVKARILDTVGRRGDREAIEVVQPQMQHKNADVASAANLALRRLRARWP
jgi:HEAT repeat protein